MKIVFMGTPEFAVPTLRALCASPHHVCAVYTQPPRPAGRGMRLKESPVAQEAHGRSIPVFSPTSLAGEEDMLRARGFGADLAIVVAYGLLLPPSFLEIFPLGCYNLHASLLPRWRGAAPIARAIMAQDAITGVCVMRMTQGLDCGPVALCHPCPIALGDTAQDLHDRLAHDGAALMIEALDHLIEGNLRLTPQPDEGVTIARKIRKEEAKIDFHRPVAEVVAHIHGLSPFPGAWTTFSGVRMKILRARAAAFTLGDSPGEAGHIVDGEGGIACIDGVLYPLLVQREGKAPMEMEAYLRGFPMDVGMACGI